MKICLQVEERFRPHRSFIGRKWRCVVSCAHRTALTLVPIENGAGWVSQVVWRLWRRGKVVCARRGTPDCPAVILVTIPTTPFRLPFSRELSFYNVILKLRIQWVVEVWKYSYNMTLVQRGRGRVGGS